MTSVPAFLVGSHGNCTPTGGRGTGPGHQSRPSGGRRGWQGTDLQNDVLCVRSVFPSCSWGRVPRAPGHGGRCSRVVRRSCEAAGGTALTFCFGVDGHSPVHEAGVQAPRRAGQAHDRGLLGGEELLQADLLGALAALVDGDAVGATSTLTRVPHGHSDGARGPRRRRAHRCRVARPNRVGPPALPETRGCLSLSYAVREAFGVTAAPSSLCVWELHSARVVLILRPVPTCLPYGGNTDVALKSTGGTPRRRGGGSGRTPPATCTAAPSAGSDPTRPSSTRNAAGW